MHSPLIKSEQNHGHLTQVEADEVFGFTCHITKLSARYGATWLVLVHSSLIGAVLPSS